MIRADRPIYQDCAFDEIPTWQPHPWVKNEGGANELTEQELRDRYIGYYAAVHRDRRQHRPRRQRPQLRGQWENTIIIYTSDHGCAIGHQGFFGKGNSTRPLNMYEISLQVPLIIAGAGIAAQVRDEYVDHYDTFHTICQLAQVKPPSDTYAGASYGDMLRGERIAWDNTRYGEYGDLRMIRDQDWKLVWRYPEGPHDLFDLRADPAERVNCIAQQPRLVAELQGAPGRLLRRSHEAPALSGLRVKQQPQHNGSSEAWRDGCREARGLQVY